jgi:hypothetical protein
VARQVVELQSREVLLLHRGGFRVRKITPVGTIRRKIEKRYSGVATTTVNLITNERHMNAERARKHL